MVLLILRKRRLAALALAVLTVGIGLLWLPQRQAAAALSAAQARPVVVLDAGHGGADGGAVSDSGVAESGINLAITQRLAEVLCFFGQPVVLTRTGTDALCGPEESQNYVNFRFKGGGAGFDQRSLRLSCVRRALTHFGFTVRAAGDLLDASLSRLPEHVVQKRLAMLGCLLAATRMLDMRLASEADADAWVAQFLERTDR